MNVFALDPGLSNGGIALASAGIGLVWARDVNIPGGTAPEMVEAITKLLRSLPEGGHLVSEWPTKYPHRRMAHVTIEAMRAVVRRVEKLRPWADLARVSPGRWSGTVPKRIRNLRVEESLSDPERIVWDQLGPDGKDAAALALWQLRAYEFRGA